MLNEVDTQEPEEQEEQMMDDTNQDSEEDSVTELYSYRRKK
jgi:hypothetical protein